MSSEFSSFSVENNQSNIPMSSSLERRLNSPSLSYLNLSNSKIVLLDFLVDLPNIEVLILQNNYIQSLDYIWHCKNLFHLDVSVNKIQSIDGVTRFAVLGMLNASNNEIGWREIERIQDIQLIDAHFSGNTVLERELAYYRTHMIDSLPNLWSLDGRMITALERSRVKDFFQQSELSSKPVRHKLSGTSFKQSNSRHGEIVTKRGSLFLRKFNITVSHTSQLDEQRLIHAAEQFSEDLFSLNGPTLMDSPALPESLVTFPKLFVDALKLAEVDIAFGVDLLSALITTLLLDLPAELIPFVIELPQQTRRINRELLSPQIFFETSVNIRIRLASFLLTRVELDFADHDKTRFVLDNIHDPAFIGIANHILLSYLKITPTDPRRLVSGSTSQQLPEALITVHRQCSVLFGGRTVHKLLKNVFSVAKEELGEELKDVIMTGAELIYSDLMIPVVSLIREENGSENIASMKKAIFSIKNEDKGQNPSIKINNSHMAITEGVDSVSGPSPAENSNLSTLFRDLHNLYSELIDRLPYFYELSAHSISLSASKLGNVGALVTPIGSTHALLPRPAPTSLRGRDALKVGKHVPPSGPPPLKARPAPRRPKIGDLVLVAIQHTGRIIAVPDHFTVCVQLDILPDKVGLHPPGSHPFRPQFALLGNPTSAIRKAPATLSSEYSYMYFSLDDLRWDSGNCIWRSHITGSTSSGQMYLNRAVASSPIPDHISRIDSANIGSPGMSAIDVSNKGLERDDDRFIDIDDETDLSDQSRNEEFENVGIYTVTDSDTSVSARVFIRSNSNLAPLKRTPSLSVSPRVRRFNEAPIAKITTLDFAPILRRRITRKALSERKQFRRRFRSLLLRGDFNDISSAPINFEAHTSIPSFEPNPKPFSLNL